jgi:hypothetical protein
MRVLPKGVSIQSFARETQGKRKQKFPTMVTITRHGSLMSAHENSQLSWVEELRRETIAGAGVATGPLHDTSERRGFETSARAGMGLACLVGVCDKAGERSPDFSMRGGNVGCENRFQ